MSAPQDGAPRRGPGLYERMVPKGKAKGNEAKFLRAIRTNTPIELKKLLPLPDGWKHKLELTLEGQVSRRALRFADGPKIKKPSYEVKKRMRSAGKVVIPKEEQKYALYEPLTELWTQYAQGIVSGATEKNIGDRVLRMDLHGALVEVVRSKDPGLVGKKGILVAETANTVLVVTREDRVVTVPKSVAVIRMAVGAHTVELMLPALAYRASERSARKLKRCKLNVLM